MDETPNCSGGAEMLIARMKSHPEEFMYGQRFSWVVGMITGQQPLDRPVSNGRYTLSRRDRMALMSAYEELGEQTLSELVVTEVMNPAPAPAQETATQVLLKQQQMAGQWNQIYGQHKPANNTLAGLGNALAGVNSTATIGDQIRAYPVSDLGNYQEPESQQSYFGKLFKRRT